MFQKDFPLLSTKTKFNRESWKGDNNRLFEFKQGDQLYFFPEKQNIFSSFRNRTTSLTDGWGCSLSLGCSFS